MTPRAKVGLVVAVLFIVVNLVSVPYHAARGELLWAGVHAALVIPAAYLVRRLVRRRGGAAVAAQPGELDDRLTHIEQSVDAVAVEVERIGEGQRFMTRLFTESGTPEAPGQGAAEPNESKAREAAPHVRRD